MKNGLRMVVAVENMEGGKVMLYKEWEKIFISAAHDHVRIGMSTKPYLFTSDDKQMRGLWKYLSKHIELTKKGKSSSSSLVVLNGLYGETPVFITVRLKIFDNHVDKSAHVLVYPMNKREAVLELVITNGVLHRETLRLDRLMF